MERHTDDLFALAREALTTRALELAATRKAALRCDECATTGDHSTADCRFPHKHVPLFPELEHSAVLSHEGRAEPTQPQPTHANE